MLELLFHDQYLCTWSGNFLRCNRNSIPIKPMWPGTRVVRECLLNETWWLSPAKREIVYINVRTTANELSRIFLYGSKYWALFEPVKFFLRWHPRKDTTRKENGILGWKGFLSQKEMKILILQVMCINLTLTSSTGEGCNIH